MKYLEWLEWELELKAHYDFYDCVRARNAYAHKHPDALVWPVFSEPAVEVESLSGSAGNPQRAQMAVYSIWCPPVQRRKKRVDQ